MDHNAPQTPSDGELPPAEQNPAARAGLSEERIAELRASGYVPRGMTFLTCPHCEGVTAVAADLPRHKQRCTHCGRLAEEEPVKKKRRLRKHRLAPDGVSARRSRERVWMPMAGTALCAVMVVLFALWMKTRGKPPEAELEPVPPTPREAITALAKKFTAARTPEELLPLIRNSGTFEKAVRDWCPAHPGALPLGGPVMNITIPRPALGTRLANATIAFKTLPRLSVLTVETPEGWRVEWPAFSGIGDLGVEEFLGQPPSTPKLLMVHVRRADYYNNAYADPAAWQALWITDRTEEHSFYAYASRGNPTLMEALKVLPPGDSPAPGAQTLRATRRLALRLYFATPAAAGAGQAEVDAAEGDGWYVP